MGSRSGQTISWWPPWQSCHHAYMADTGSEIECITWQSAYLLLTWSGILCLRCQQESRRLDIGPAGSRGWGGQFRCLLRLPIVYKAIMWKNIEKLSLNCLFDLHASTNSFMRWYVKCRLTKMSWSNWSPICLSLFATSASLWSITTSISWSSTSGSLQ